MRARIFTAVGTVFLGLAALVASGSTVNATTAPGPNKAFSTTIQPQFYGFCYKVGKKGKGELRLLNRVDPMASKWGVCGKGERYLSVMSGLPQKISFLFDTNRYGCALNVNQYVCVRVVAPTPSPSPSATPSA